MTIFGRATINYFPRPEAPRGTRASREVDLTDGRSVELPGWEVAGFELVPHRSQVTDWGDDEQLSSIHYPEVETLAREMTGAEVALVSSHIRRGPDHAARHHQLSPINVVHSDFADTHIEIIRNSYRGERPGAAKALSRNGVGPDAVTTAARVVILQFWRNVGPPKMDYPLAFCDARTVSLDHGRSFHITNYAGTGATFDALGVMAPEQPPDHEWYVFPEMTVDETVAFRTYDTHIVRAGGIYFTPHSAVRDPDVPVGEPARSSVELRATCLFF